MGLRIKDYFYSSQWSLCLLNASPLNVQPSFQIPNWRCASSTWTSGIASDGPPLLPPTSFPSFRPNRSSKEIPLALSSEHAGICPLHFPRTTPGSRGSLPLLSAPCSRRLLSWRCCHSAPSPGAASPSSTGGGEPTLSRPPDPACSAFTRHLARPPLLSYLLLTLCSSLSSCTWHKPHRGSGFYVLLTDAR